MHLYKWNHMHLLKRILCLFPTHKVCVEHFLLKHFILINLLKKKRKYHITYLIFYIPFGYYYVIVLKILKQMNIWHIFKTFSIPHTFRSDIRYLYLIDIHDIHKNSDCHWNLQGNFFSFIMTHLIMTPCWFNMLVVTYI